MIREEAKLRPVVEWGGREFLVDVDSRRFRDLNDVDGFIDMHLPQGRAIVKQMQDTQRTTHAVDTMGELDVAV